MIIGHGRGVAVAGIVLGCSLAANLLSNALSGSGAYWDSHAWPVATAMMVASGLIWLLERHVRRRADGAATTGEAAASGSHHLFFIPTRYWAGIVLAAGLTLLITNTAPGPYRPNSPQSANASTGAAR